MIEEEVFDMTVTTSRAGVPATTDCVVVGGGPAGLICGLILARAGVATTVVEKHADFLRDFRGDTIHPSTQDLLGELGLLEEFLALPHADTARVSLKWNAEEFVLADFTRLPTRRGVISFIPQWEFLDLIARAGQREASFTLLRTTEVVDIIADGEQVLGVQMRSETGETTLLARLVIAADGRDSTVRSAAGMVPRSLANAMDVLWFRVPKRGSETLPFIQAGAGLVVAIDRDEFFQIAHAIPVGTWEGSSESMDALRERVARICPALSSRVADLGIDDVRLLRVRLERLPRWHRPGLLCLGDAAHAMSPAGGVGVNLAIQDAVAAARELAPVLRVGRPTPAQLDRIRRRRAGAAALVQWVQQRIQPVLLADRPAARPPLPLGLIARFPVLAHLPGRLVGLGLRPEHIASRRRRR